MKKLQHIERPIQIEGAQYYGRIPKRIKINYARQ